MCRVLHCVSCASLGVTNTRRDSRGVGVIPRPVNMIYTHNKRHSQHDPLRERNEFALPLIHTLCFSPLTRAGGFRQGSNTTKQSFCFTCVAASTKPVDLVANVAPAERSGACRPVAWHLSGTGKHCLPFLLSLAPPYSSWPQHLFSCMEVQRRLSTDHCFYVVDTGHAFTPQPPTPTSPQPPMKSGTINTIDTSLVVGPSISFHSVLCFGVDCTVPGT